MSSSSPERVSRPPSIADAARIVDAAWKISPDWGMFVWLMAVTAMRRGEAVALRWSNVDLDEGTVTVRHKSWTSTGKGDQDKDTESLQMRRLALDPTTVELLAEHRIRHLDLAPRGDEVEPKDPYLFSDEPLRDRPYNPSWVSRKYARLCEEFGIDSRVHGLRHCSATALLTRGVDLRAVARGLGYEGGCWTTS